MKTIQDSYRLFVDKVLQSKYSDEFFEYAATKYLETNESAVAAFVEKLPSRLNSALKSYRHNAGLALAAMYMLDNYPEKFTTPHSRFVAATYICRVLFPDGCANDSNSEFYPLYVEMIRSGFYEGGFSWAAYGDWAAQKGLTEYIEKVEYYAQLAS